MEEKVGQQGEESQLTESGAQSRALVLLNNLKDQTLKSKSRTPTYVVLKITPQGNIEPYSWGTREHTRHSLEDLPSVRRRRERNEFQFRGKVIGDMISGVVTAALRELKRIGR